MIYLTDEEWNTLQNMRAYLNGIQGWNQKVIAMDSLEKNTRAGLDILDRPVGDESIETMMGLINELSMRDVPLPLRSHLTRARQALDTINAKTFSGEKVTDAVNACILSRAAQEKVNLVGRNNVTRLDSVRENRDEMVNTARDRRNALSPAELEEYRRRIECS